MDITLLNLIRGLFFIGFHADRADMYSKISQYIMKGLGAVVIHDYHEYSRTYKLNVKNPNQFKELTHELQTRSANPLLIAAYVEGGANTPFKTRYGFDIKLQPPGTQANKSYIDTYQQGKKMAEELLNLGVNTNFGVIADLKKGETIQEKRYFYSDKPDEVAKRVNMFYNGASTESGFAPVVKTFLGGPEPIEKQIEVFKLLLNKDKNKADAIMISNNINNNIDTVPIACSNYAISELLRDNLGFEGLVIAEDYETSSAPENIDLKDYLILALNAGVNMFVISNNKRPNLDNFEQAVKIIYDAVDCGELDRSIIEKSYKKITEYKAKKNIV
ncbi:MAG TPA: hypothetical protein DCL21_03220 [Alphaproteobacteria bacterium]|nr:hypothetical protein [Alphaproteobacteria bacterium]